MKKVFYKLIAFVFLLLSFFNVQPLYASEAFVTDVEVEYYIFDNGISQVSHKIILENLFTNLYATSYSLSLENIYPENTKVIYKQENIDFDLKQKGSKTDIEIVFPDAIVGKGKKRYFEIVYENSKFTQRTGEVWEISIPRLSADVDFRNYNLTLSIPNSFGLEAYISPQPSSFLNNEGRRIYKYPSTSILQTGVTAGFGSFQIFSFTINYHLENPVSRTSFIEIAIPPDTNLQRMYYSNINPLPENVDVDNDGNWLAGYYLKPRERLDVQVNGSVQIFSGSRAFPTPSEKTLKSYLEKTEYWQVENPTIQGLANNFKTPENIFNYVVSTLDYSFEEVSPQNKRDGAIWALENPTKATCMEFTDLFISIARAAGIPAREINGFAYTENPEIQPLSLVADVLHSWPEYWNANTKQWVQVDPTWTSTTGGVDFFNKLDLRHFAFVIHGKDPQKPYTPGSYKLGPNPQKDVFVNFGSLPEKRNSSTNLEYHLEKGLPFTSTKYKVTVKNEGPAAIYGLKPIIAYDGLVSEEKYIEVLPPYAKADFEVTIPYSLLGKDTPNQVYVTTPNSQIVLKTYKNKVVTDSLIVIFFISIFAIICIIVRVKPLILVETWYKISQIFKKKEKKVT